MSFVSRPVEADQPYHGCGCAAADLPVLSRFKGGHGRPARVLQRERSARSIPSPKGRDERPRSSVTSHLPATPREWAGRGRPALPWMRMCCCGSACSVTLQRGARAARPCSSTRTFRAKPQGAWASRPLRSSSSAGICPTRSAFRSIDDFVISIECHQKTTHLGWIPPAYAYFHQMNLVGVGEIITFAIKRTASRSDLSTFRPQPPADHSTKTPP